MSDDTDKLKEVLAGLPPETIVALAQLAQAVAPPKSPDNPPESLSKWVDPKDVIEEVVEVDTKAEPRSSQYVQPHKKVKFITSEVDEKEREYLATHVVNVTPRDPVKTQKIKCADCGDEILAQHVTILRDKPHCNQCTNKNIRA